MVRIIANAIESGYDAEVPMRSDVDPEMQKVGLGHQKSADQGRAPCTALAVSFVLVGHLRRSTLARKSPSVYLLLYLSHARPCVSEIVFSSSASRSRMCDLVWVCVCTGCGESTTLNRVQTASAAAAALQFLGLWRAVFQMGF
jgi:hypothetical protein